MPANLQKARELFLHVVGKLPPDRWPTYVAAACGGDAELEQQVRHLLQVHLDAGSFLEGPAFALAMEGRMASLECPGTLIGPYKVLEQIGEGGFGVVFMAEQQEPVRRKVALKVLKPGMDTKQVVARFEAERQALALMDHPHIAHVLDAGATDFGRPYFVMELIRGVPITQFCDDNQLTVRERLELFVTVCQAVQHAHQKGIIHRDLKPSNVLVTLLDDAPVVKVIDFGIAKALGQERLTDKTLCTGFALMIGTPLYMSPEQAESGQNADTRTDIYSLGVLFYELLTGTTPFDKDRLKEGNFEEIRRIIREEEPAKPSTRISALGQAGIPVSANRKSQPKQLSQVLRGELDWIVMKALEKDCNRRYETASSFAADVQHYLHDEPVQACPPSAVYRLRKFARRQRRVAIMASFLFAVLVSGLTVLGISYAQVQEALQEKTRALKHERAALQQKTYTAYFQGIALADREWSANNLGRMEQLLEECPADLRGWEWHYLKRLRLPGIPPLRHDAAVFSAMFSPDGRWIASGSQDGIVKIWDATTGQECYQFQAHEPQQHVRGVAFSPDGRYLATVSWDATAKIWKFDPKQARVETSTPLTLRGHQERLFSVAFSPDSQRLASAGGDGLRVWDVATGRQVFDLRGHTHSLWSVAFSPDGQYIASASEDHTVRIWHANTGQEKLSLRSHSQAVTSVAFSQDSKNLASGTSDNNKAVGELKVWDAQTGEELLARRAHVWGIRALAFSPDGQRLASGGFDEAVKLWDLHTGQEILTLREDRGEIRSLGFSPDGNRLISASHDQTVRIWDATPSGNETGQESLTLNGHGGGVLSVAFSPDGQYLASAGDDDKVNFWDFKSARPGAANRPIHTVRSPVALALNVAFKKDGQLVASGGRDKLTIWDTISGKEAGTISNANPPVAISPDGRYLAALAADDDLAIKILDLATGRKTKLKGHSWAINDMTFGPHPDGPLLATASSDRTVRVWEVKTGKPVKILPHANTAFCVAFSHDGRRLASGGLDRVVQVWNTESWQKVHELPDPTGRVQGVVFHPKESRVVAWGSADGTVKLWDTGTGEIRTLHGHKSWVERVIFSPEGEWLVSASLDGTLKLWRMPSMSEAPPSAPGAPNLSPRGRP
jgi:WD40 repeat protein/serine/threonine protein kinase